MGYAAVPNKGRHVRRIALASGETPEEGQPVSLDASGEITAETADPSTVLGFMASINPNDMTFDPYEGDVLVYVARGDSTFWLKGTTDPTDKSDIGVRYGLTLGSDDEAQVDLTDTTNIVFVVEDVDLDRLLYEVSVVEAVRQFDDE